MMAHVVFSVCVGLPTHGQKQITRILLDNESKTHCRTPRMTLLLLLLSLLLAIRPVPLIFYLTEHVFGCLLQHFLM